MSQRIWYDECPNSKTHSDLSQNQTEVVHHQRIFSRLMSTNLMVSTVVQRQ
jgi:hypothetical protein